MSRKPGRASAPRSANASTSTRGADDHYLGSTTTLPDGYTSFSTLGYSPFGDFDGDGCADLLLRAVSRSKSGTDSAAAGWLVSGRTYEP